MAGGDYYKKQAFIVENMRALIEEELDVPTRRTRLKLLSPWQLGKYSYECHPNPYSAESYPLEMHAMTTGLPLDVCLNTWDTGIVLKEDPRLPYACPGRIMRGPVSPDGRRLVYSTVMDVECDGFRGFEPVIYDTYIVEAALEGSNPVELVVEWCPLGLVEQGDLFDRVKYAVRLASELNGSGRGVKISIVPGYATGSRHLDGIYWSSGVYYMSEAELASGISRAINAHIYIVGGDHVDGFKLLDIPFLYGGWVHTYLSGVPPAVITTKSRPRWIDRFDPWEQAFEFIESYLENAAGIDLPLEARGILFHLHRIISSRCTGGLRVLIPHILHPIHGEGVSGLRLLPWLTLYEDTGVVIYDLEYGRRLYTGIDRLRYETLVYNLNSLKRVLIEADRLCIGDSGK